MFLLNGGTTYMHMTNSRNSRVQVWSDTSSFQAMCKGEFTNLPHRIPSYSFWNRFHMAWESTQWILWHKMWRPISRYLKSGLTSRFKEYKPFLHRISQFSFFCYAHISKDFMEAVNYQHALETNHLNRWWSGSHCEPVCPSPNISDQLGLHVNWTLKPSPVVSFEMLKFIQSESIFLIHKTGFRSKGSAFPPLSLETNIKSCQTSFP